MALERTFCICLLPAPVSAVKLPQRWPLHPNKLILHFLFQAYCHSGRERCLMNCLVRRQLCLPISTYPSSQFLHHFLIYSHISAAFCWATAFSLNWKAPGGVNSSSVERYIICWDLHVVECLKSTKMFHCKTAVIPDTLIPPIHWIWQRTRWVTSEIKEIFYWCWKQNWTQYTKNILVAPSNCVCWSIIPVTRQGFFVGNCWEYVLSHSLLIYSVLINLLLNRNT